MSGLIFDYEFVFLLGVFDQVIYDQCKVVDTDGTRLQKVKDTISEIKQLFINIPGLNMFSTFFEEGNLKFKVTLDNPYN